MNTEGRVEIRVNTEGRVEIRVNTEGRVAVRVNTGTGGGKVNTQRDRWRYG